MKPLNRFPVATIAALLAALLIHSSVTRTWAAEDAEEFFNSTRVWSIHLEVMPVEFDAMQPPLPGGPGAPASNPPGTDRRESERNLFGTEFRWAQANFTGDGKTLEKVGMRYAGDMTYLVSAAGVKRPLKLAFDKFQDQKFHGLSALQLHAMPLDPSKSREALASSIFRACGVPAPRTAFAEVTLSVPGRFEKLSLGLYTVVEDIDKQFFEKRFGTADGLAMKPFGIRGIDFLGDAWNAYAGAYRPQRMVTAEEQAHVIAFARLVNSASDEDFERQIGKFIEVEAFLRYMAANALTSNLENFLALGHNYTLYLDPRSRQFHFIPGDLEFSFANLLLFGSPAELMDLSLAKPYPAENKLPDRLLRIKANAERYRVVLSELASTVFTSDRLSKESAAIEKATESVRVKEQEAAAARPAAPAGPFGAPGAGGPQPPDLKTFIRQRTQSVADQLAGTGKGYVPRPFQFGPRPGQSARTSQPIDEAAFRQSVKVPEEFEATLFATPPRVNYPVAIACEPAGAVYVAVDEQGSLGRAVGGGRILRCVDADDDGKVDQVTIFAKVEHPRGVTYRDGKVWVMHPPTLTVFEDTDKDGVADKEDVLVTGLTTNQVTDRGGDHTTNCVRMGIDGWLYIGVGDYGIQLATGKDGRTIVQRGGGIVRVRPDGTELEVYCTGFRNPFDLAIDPFLNIFTRDNTNDGAGWDTRVSLIKQSAVYGYTQLFANFTDEIMPTLGTFGNGGGSGGLFLQDPRWPPEYNNTLYTGDWGTSEVYRHPLAPNGPTFDLRQDVFAKVPRATGMDVDAHGRLYVASFLGGSAAGFEGPNIGFVARITPKQLRFESFPDLKQSSLDSLLHLLSSPVAVIRHHAQGEVLARGRSPETTQKLFALASDDTTLLEGRVAAVLTLKQLDGAESRDQLHKLAAIAPLREFALRALTDRVTELQDLPPDLFVEALADPSPRVRAQALISLGRLNQPGVARQVIPLTTREPGSEMPARRPLQNQPDPGRVIPHLAVRALVSLNATEACLEALDGPHAAGALWAMRSMHTPAAVEGLIKRLRTAHSAELRRGILTTLIRLYHREADYDGSWWGIRPDNTGPYYDRSKWKMSERIESVLTVAIRDGEPEAVADLKRELLRHQVALPGITNDAEQATAAEEVAIVIPKADPGNPDLIGNLGVESAITRALAAEGDAMRGAALFKSQSCNACHTTADGQTPKGPHLFEIGKRYQPAELVESILKPSAKLAQGYETYLFALTDGRNVHGFVVSERAGSTLIREANGTQREIKKSDVEEKLIQKLSAMPEGLVANLTPRQLADLVAYLQSLK